MLGKLYLVGEDVPQDKEAALRWLTQSAEQGNTYAQFYTEHWAVAAQNPSVFLSATRLLHHMLREGKTSDDIKAINKQQNIFGAPTAERAEKICNTVIARINCLDKSFYPVFLESDIATQKLFALAADMKELFHSSTVSEDEDSVMKTFQTYCQHMITDLQILETRYEEKRYPGKKAVADGKKLLQAVMQQTTPLEFFQTVAKMSDDLIDFAYDYEPIKAFFGGEQKTIFERALDMLAIYDDSKTYIVDADLESVVAQMHAITSKTEPYKDIPKLPELRELFM